MTAGSPAGILADAQASTADLAGALRRWQLHPLRAELRRKAKQAGLWNLWISAAMAEELRPLVRVVSPLCSIDCHVAIINSPR